MKIEKIISWLDRTLKVSDFDDVSNNGLQLDRLPALSTRHQALSTASVGRIQPPLKSRHGILQLPLAVTGLQFPCLFKNGLDVVVVAVVRPEVAVVVRAEARLDDLVRGGARYLISGNLPLFAFDLRLRLVRVSARARS